MIHPYRGISPRIHETVYIAHGVQLIGDVVIGENSSIWFNAVIRGDVNHIRIGDRTNVQDGSLLHVRNQTSPLLIGSDVTLGHGVIAHGCTIHDNCLIGMGAVVLDNAEINSYTLVAAGAVVRNNSTFPEGVLLAGVPARIVREITAGERALIEESAAHYVGYARTYRETSS